MNGPSTTPDPPEAATATPREAPRLVDLPTRPDTPIVLRPVGCDAETIGMNTDCFTLGSVEGVDAPLPAAMAPAGQAIKLRFVRAAEGWRVALVEGAGLFVNQTLSQGGSALRAGDVLRLAPGGPGIQFTLTHDKAESIARLAARHAPRLLAGSADTPTESPTPDPMAGPARDSLTRSPVLWRYAAIGVLLATLLVILLAARLNPTAPPDGVEASDAPGLSATSSDANAQP